MAIMFYCLFRSCKRARNSVIVFCIMPSDLLPSNLRWLLLIAEVFRWRSLGNWESRTAHNPRLSLSWLLECEKESGAATSAGDREVESKADKMSRVHRNVISFKSRPLSN